MRGLDRGQDRGQDGGQDPSCCTSALAQPGADAAVSSRSSSVSTAKQKLEDRLAAAAREKLAQASKESKEKQLQAERKRKAALFLQTLRTPHPGEPEAKRAELDSCLQLEVSVLGTSTPGAVWSSQSAEAPLILVSSRTPPVSSPDLLPPFRNSPAARTTRLLIAAGTPRPPTAAPEETETETKRRRSTRGGPGPGPSPSPSADIHFPAPTGGSVGPGETTDVSQVPADGTFTVVVIKMILPDVLTLHY